MQEIHLCFMLVLDVNKTFRAVRQLIMKKKKKKTSSLCLNLKKFQIFKMKIFTNDF